MKIIGLTGGIGAGKSTVSSQLRKKGFHILDADQVARELVLPGSEALIEIAATFGNEVLFEDGTLNRKKLGRIVFADPEKTMLLDQIMRDKILEILYDRLAAFRERAESVNDGIEAGKLQQSQIIFIDAPLLFESGLDQLTQEVWVVDADDETRIQRVMERDSLSRSEIEERIGRQMDRSEKLRRAQHILDNSGDVESLYQQLDQLLFDLRSSNEEQ